MSDRQPVLHKLKIDRNYVKNCIHDHKNYELRKADRDYQVGDRLLLEETRYTAEEMRAGASVRYTGFEMSRLITHVLTGPVLGLKEGWVILSTIPDSARNSMEVSDG